MDNSDVSRDDYTNITIATIISLSLSIILYLSFSEIVQTVIEVSESFVTESPLILLYRLICLCVGIYAIVSMFTCGPGNMRVVTRTENKQVVLNPVGVEKFVTFSSWTLLMYVGYFLTAIIGQIIEMYNYSNTLLLGIQTMMFVTGISMAFLTATIVRYIILPDEVKIGRDHGHMFLFHEQIMHNFAAIFLAFELLMIEPELHPQLAIFGLLIGIVYLIFAYWLAYYSGAYFVYSFLHPKPKTAPAFVIGIASIIALFYLGLWSITLLNQYNSWLSWLVIIVWLSLIVQFRPDITDN